MLAASALPSFSWFLLVVVFALSRATIAAPSTLQPCYNNLQQCVEDAGFEELKVLHQWIMNNPASAYALPKIQIQSSPLENAAFALFSDLGFSVLASILDLVNLCQVSDNRCTHPADHFQKELTPFLSALEQHMAALVRDYSLQTGIRTCVIRAGRNLRSDLMKLSHDMPGVTDIVKAIQRVSELVHLIGHRSRMLAHEIGMHAWVRSLPVPSRGTPMFLFHDEYSTQSGMVTTLVENMVRNGQTQLSFVEVGATSKQDWRSLLHEFQGLQYLGVYLDSAERNQLAERDEQQREYQQARDHLKEYSHRTGLSLTSSAAAAAGIPLRALDIAVVRANRDYSSVAEDLVLWEARVKPGGILAGYDFLPEWQDGVQAVCQHRFANEIHLGVDGTFWWYVEPEE